jgi:hypothetical protein
LREDTALLERQLAQAKAALPGIAQAAAGARHAYADHNLALGGYVDAQSAYVSKRIEVATLQESIAEQRVGLQALLGGTMPDAFSSDLTLIQSHDH